VLLKELNLKKKNLFIRRLLLSGVRGYESQRLGDTSVNGRACMTQESICGRRM